MGALNWRHINLKIYDSNENLVAEPIHRMVYYLKTM